MINLKSHAQEIAVVVILAVTFAAGRYSARQPEIKETSRVESETHKDVVKDKKTIVVKAPDGTRTTTITEQTPTQLQQVTEAQTARSSSSVTRTGITVLGGFDAKTSTAVYGVAAQKEVAGPITAGVWALNSGTIGVSVGLNF